VAQLKLSRAEIGKSSNAAIWIEYDEITLDITGIGYENGISKELKVDFQKGLGKVSNTIPEDGNGTLLVNPLVAGKVIEIKDPETQETVIDLPSDFEFRFNF
jgi:hypothetical protein